MIYFLFLGHSNAMEVSGGEGLVSSDNTNVFNLNHVVGAGQVGPPVDPDSAVEDAVLVHHRLAQPRTWVTGVENLCPPPHLADGVAEGALHKETVYKWTLITSDMFLTTTDLFVVDLDVVHGAVVDEVGHVAE